LHAQIGSAGAQKGASAEIQSSIRLSKTIVNGYLLDASQDGGKICAYFAVEPLTSFTFRPGTGWLWGKGVANHDSFAVLETTGWSTVFRSQLSESPVSASFFSDGERIYVETRATAKGVYQRIAAELKTARIAEHTFVRQAGMDRCRFLALGDGLLLGMVSPSSAARIEALVIARSEDFSEVARVPYALAATRGSTPDTDVFLSDDRRTAAYCASGSLVVRRTSDLAVLWTAAIESRYYGVRRITFTPQGKIIAVAVMDTFADDFQREYYVALSRAKLDVRSSDWR
jgi:hypothetical protein